MTCCRSNEDAFYEDWEMSGQDEMNELYLKTRQLQSFNDALERTIRNVKELKRLGEECRSK
jgi:hypothetical protein